MRAPRPLRHPVCLTATSLLLLGAALPLRADDRIVYYGQPTEPPGFFHRVGDFFRDLFAADQSLSPRPTPPRPTGPRYNLDLPPPGTGYGYGNLAGNSDPYATEKSQTIAAHEGAVHRSRVATTTTTKRTSRTVVDPDDAPSPSTTTRRTVTVEESSPKPSVKHIPTTAPEERPSASSSKVALDDAPKPVTPKVSSNVPTGTRTSKSTRVKSPYPPYNELDVTGLAPGSLAMDPTTQKVFRVP